MNPTRLQYATKIRALFATTLFGIGLVSIPAQASLFLDYSNGITLMSESINNSDLDDGIISRPLTITHRFFGDQLTNFNATISVNGHINFDGDDEYFNRPLGVVPANRIAPMWQDYKISAGSNGRIIESMNDTLDYYAVTWLNVENAVAGTASGNFANFQAIFFFNDSVINSVGFQAGDIVFSYGEFTNGFIGTEPTIGLESVFGDITPLVGIEMTDGVYYSDFYDPLPTGQGQYVLFRPNGSYNYTSSIHTAIPEPSTYAAFAGGLALVGAAVWRRRQRA